MKKVFVVAGGTGGHINAALAVGEELSDQYEVKYLSGTRYLDYQLFKGTDVTHLESRALRTKNPLTLIKNTFLNILVFVKIFFIYLSSRPKFVIGAGGYICGPTLLAAKILFIPVFIIEQNAIAGVTNKILARFSDIVFTNFKKTKGINSTKKVINVGNPIRKSIQEVENERKEKLKILIFGGSLGATQINEAIEILVESDRFSNYEIRHQVGKGNINIEGRDSYTQTEYIDDMQAAYKWCNLIISRSGASTVSELRIIKKPTIIIPFPAATDNHQFFNAVELQEEDNFFVNIVDQKLKGEELAKTIFEAVKKIDEESLYYQKQTDVVNACLLIRKEIENYVRN